MVRKGVSGLSGLSGTGVSGTAGLSGTSPGILRPKTNLTTVSRNRTLSFLRNSGGARSGKSVPKSPESPESQSRKHALRTFRTFRNLFPDRPSSICSLRLIGAGQNFTVGTRILGKRPTTTNVYQNHREKTKIALARSPVAKSGPDLTSRQQLPSSFDPTRVGVKLNPFLLGNLSG